MCGISGFLDTRLSLDEKKGVLTKMMSAIAHRGPDDFGSFVDDDVALGFRRLSIIDVAAGHQPLCNEDASLWLTFNGEIYNYLELRAGLIERGHRFATHTDSEVILHLFEEQGIECIKLLRGMFAFVIWDTATKTLYGARDRFGIKPLYYTRQGGAFIYASEAKAILEHPAVVRAVDEDSLQHYFTFQFVPDPATLFKGIRRLPPAHYFSLRDGQLSLNKYWQLEFRPERKPASYFVEGTEHLLTEAVRMHMMSEVPRGAFLSGGVDSSVIVALLRKMGDLSTYSVGYAEAKYDELPEARYTAHALATDHHEVRVSAEDMWEALPDIIWHMDEPVADPAACALYFVAKRASQDITVVLSGEGADEVFGGYGIYREPGEVRKFARFPSPMRALLASIGRMLPEGVKGKDYLRRATTPLAERYFGNALIFSEAQKDRLLALRSNRRLLPTDITRPYFEQAKELDDIAQMQYLDFNTWLAGDILVKADRMTMAHSLELRVPFLDHHLVEFAATIPPELKVNGNMTKYVLRQAALNWLPPEVAKRPKRGFPVPTREWIKRDWQARFAATLKRSSISHYVNTNYAQEMLAEHIAGKSDHSRRLWTILVFQLWHRLYIER
ncbi:MAG: Asparagine synthetase (glutamine-hydrolyzing) 1 [Firmicutes bacterium]|nr:Asparagine synthetase (glutamine-hydrolyzing) 1 [candidate division NPL-UPA2 bacterium]